MAKNIFSMFQGYVPKPKRNVFDLSFNNNFTTKFGQLTPVLCKEVIPGDSFKIDTAAGLRLMPMAFPVQTPMKAYVHYFYVRNRALWKDWQDFITGTKSGLVPPYISFNSQSQKKDFFKVGGIADYFGVPNIVYRGASVEYGIGDMSDYQNHSFGYGTDEYAGQIGYALKIPTADFPYIVRNEFFPFVDRTTVEHDGFMDVPTLHMPDYRDTMFYNDTETAINAVIADNTKGPWYRIFRANVDVTGVAGCTITIHNNDVHYTSLPVQYRTFIVCAFNSATNEYSNPLIVQANGEVVNYSVNNTLHQKFTLVLTDEQARTLRDFGGDSLDVFTYYNTSGNFAYFSLQYANSNSEINPVVEFTLSSLSEDGSTSAVIGDGDFTDTPFDSDIRLSALPFRAYECIYNSYYRNMQNNPYILNGVEEYNKYIPSNEGGSDINEYKLHQRNWEYDFMTSAVPSPQFGVAPLVGITMTGTATFQDENGTTYYAQAELDDDGTITGWSTHSSNMPAGTLRMLMDNVGTGISINDLRNVNSFQRFLENSLRVGLKYRDQIKGHFGVDVRYDELEMPEFIGGMSLDINVNQVTQTADITDSSYPLAGFAGQAGAFGSSKHSVTKYCDEHGFIIGILSVVPVPVYSQLLPKFFLKNEQLDYFYPEFGHIGYQPILQKEVSPLQSYYSEKNLDDVFAYQRAWYDYIASTDEVHSQFRTTLRNFVMNRTFADVPALNEEFLLVDPEQINDVFLVTSSGEYGPESDKILGQIYFKITKKSPIPILGIPRLTD